MKALAVLVATAGVAEAGSHCHEVSPIVGRQHCGGFGSRWAHQPLLGLVGYEAGFVLDRIPVPAIDESGTVYSTTGPATYHATTPRRVMYGMGPRQRFGWRGAHTVLVVEMAAAWALDAPTLSTSIDGGAPSTSSHGSVFDATAVGGLHTRAGAFELGTELGVGLRDLTFSAPLTGYTRCDNGGTGKGCAFAVTEASPLVEVRVRADAWIDPQFTIGVSAGVDLVHGGETFVLTLGFHGVVFDGQ